MRGSVKFLIVFFLTFAQVLAVVALFNRWADPYHIYSHRPYEASRPLWMSKQLRRAKAYYIRHAKPKGIIVGASTSELGLDPDHPGWNSQVYPRYNLAFPGSFLYENFRFLQHALAVSPVQQVLVGLDFVAFNRFAPLSDDFYEKDLWTSVEGEPTRDAFRDVQITLLSLTAVTAGQKKLFSRGEGTHFANGRQIPERQENRNNRSAMVGSAQGFVTRLLFHPPAHKYCLFDQDGRNVNFDYLRAMIRFARAAGADIRLFIQPPHATLLEVLHYAGLWPVYEAWVQALAALVNEENHAESDKPPVPLWDFSGYNPITTEPISPSAEPTAPMRWYWDVGHYNKDLGDRIQDRIFDFHDPEREIPSDFGRKIHPGNVEDHLAEMRLKREAYVLENSADLADIHERVQRIMKNIPPYDCGD